MIAQAEFAQDLLQNFTGKQFSTFPEGAKAFAECYARFGAKVTTNTGGTPTAIEPGKQALFAALTGALGSMNMGNTANILQQAIMAFWMSQPWSGGTGPGQTTAPGNATVGQDLVRVFTQGIHEAAPSYHAQSLAEVCAKGVRMVQVTEYPPGSSPKTAPVI